MWPKRLVPNQEQFDLEICQLTIAPCSQSTMVTVFAAETAHGQWWVFILGGSHFVTVAFSEYTQRGALNVQLFFLT